MAQVAVRLAHICVRQWPLKSRLLEDGKILDHLRISCAWQSSAYATKVGAMAATAGRELPSPPLFGQRLSLHDALRRMNSSEEHTVLGSSELCYSIEPASRSQRVDA